MEPSELLRRYRRDRRRLFEFILSSGLVRAPSDLAGADLDTLSIDYVLECIQSGGAFDLSEAKQKYLDELCFPIVLNSSFGNSYFLLSNPESSGSPPQRDAPQVLVKTMSNHSLCSAEQPDHFVGTEIDESGEENGIGDHATKFLRCQSLKDANALFLGLPTLKTGLSDDDLRETAYEVLLASVVLKGGWIQYCEEEKKEKRSRSIIGRRFKRDESGSRPQPADGHSDLLEVIRVQMEISEAMNTRTKQGLRNFSSRMTHEQTDVPQISLELLNMISRSDFPSEKAYIQWHKRQAHILEELLHASNEHVPDGHEPLNTLLLKLRNREEGVSDNGPNRCAEVLTTLRTYALCLSSMPVKFGIPGETYYWTATYHFNVILYEKLLFSVFDVLEDGQLVVEAEEILVVLKLTWSTLGITEKMHNALYTWVLFQQFVRTGEASLLSIIVGEMQRILTSQDSGREEVYMSSLICTGPHHSDTALSLVDAIFYNINAWCSSQLEDYHLHFSEGNYVTFEIVVALAILLGTYLANKCGDIVCDYSTTEIELASKLMRLYIERSVQNAYIRVLDLSSAKAKVEQKHPLAMLANELKLIAEKESALFTPVLCRQYPEAGRHSSILLHQLYGKELKPFLEGVSNLSDGVRSVLAASDSLEHWLTRKCYASCQDDVKLPIIYPYQIRDVCRPLILHWLDAQHDNILEWTMRAIHIEDWEPLSSQQKQALSIIEVLRIIEETIDQFFNLNLPMDIVHLRYLLIGIVRSLGAYLQHIVSQQVDKDILYPIPPSLTRYKESMNPFMKKKHVEQTLLQEKVTSQLTHLTASKLCVKLNTLHYIRHQLDALEDAIQESWMLVRQVQDQHHEASKEELSTSSDSIDELFSIFDDIRRSAIDAGDTIIDFIGPRVVFWDVRDSFLLSLYQGSVESARLEIFVPKLDEALDHVCDLLIDTLRDQVVLSICQASMEAYIWVLLDGGPSRNFSENDVKAMQEDLNILKDLFVADGQGIPRNVVEKEARLAQQILDLYSMKADMIIEMLMNASEQISNRPYSRKPGSRSAKDADTLLRVLCHKKDKDASKYLKMQYHLPKSSDYEESQEKEPTASPFLSEIFKRNTSSNWAETGQRSFRLMKKKFQEATSEIRHAPW